MINRFSEDIDVSVERTYLGFKNDKDPANATPKQAKKLIEELGIACQHFVSNELFNRLNDTIISKIGKNHFTSVSEYQVQWCESRVNLAELAKLRFIDGWSRKQLAEYYGRTEMAIQNYFQNLKKKDFSA